MTVFEYYVLSIFDMLSIIILSRKVMNYKPIINIKNIILSILIPIISVSLTDLVDVSAYLGIIINTFIFWCIIKIIYKRSNINTLWIYVISLIIFVPLQFIAFMIINLIYGEFNLIFVPTVIAQAITVLFTCIIYYYAPINLIYNFVQSKNKIFNLILINSFLIVISLVFYWYINIQAVSQNIIFILVLSTIVIFINLVTIRNGLLMKHQKGQLHIYENYLPIVDELITELRARQHEFDNHIQAISMLGDTCNNYDELVSELKKYSRYVLEKNEMTNLLKINNKVLAGFIYSKKKFFQENNISISIIINNYSIDTRAEDYELIEIMGTLLDNAYEACIENSQNKISLTIDSNEDKLLIIVQNQNPYLELKIIKKIFNKGFSTKKSGSKKRGYGLYNMKNIVDRYNGDISVSNEDINGDNWVVFYVSI